MFIYTKYLIKQISWLKILVSFIAILSIAAIAINYYKEFQITLLEFVLCIFSDKLFLSIIIIMLLLILTSSLFKIESQDTQFIIRLEKTNKWYMSNFITSVILCLLLVLIIFFGLMIIGIISGLKFSFIWSESVATNTINIVDGLDYTGHPFEILIANNTSPLTAALLGLVLLFFRCLFYANLINMLQILVRNRVGSIFILILLNIIDVYFYNIFLIPNKFILPHEYSIITSIDGQSTSIILIFLYWLILIIGSTIFCMSNSYIQKDWLLLKSISHED